MPSPSRAAAAPDMRLTQRVDERGYVGTANAVYQNLDILHEADRARFHVSARGAVLVTPERLGQSVHTVY